jgi:ribosomal 30S subunit maturation factor RimM
MEDAMPTYRLTWSEDVVLTLDIEAESEDEAFRMFEDGDYHYGDIEKTTVYTEDPEIERV